MTKPNTKQITLDVITLANVAAMAVETGLLIGQSCQTLGYTTAGDGGGRLYQIVAAGTGVDDGSSFIDLVDHQAQAHKQSWITFANTDATPTVREGINFNTAGTTTITTFDDGVDGQRIMVKADDTIIVVGVSMVSGDVANFVNDNDTWFNVNL